MSDVITGLFKNSTAATNAIFRLESAGVTHSDVSVVANDSYSKESFGVEEGTKASEGGIVGAAGTGIVAAIAAGLTAVGTVATGGAGLIAAGPIVAALAAGGAGAAVGGSVGAIIGAFIPEHEIKYYEDAIKEGSVLVGVKYTSDNKDRIKDILEKAGAEKVATA